MKSFHTMRPARRLFTRARSFVSPPRRKARRKDAPALYIGRVLCYTCFMNLIFINGTMGAGKTATARALQKIVPPCVFADGDNFWDMNPFTVNETSEKLVLANISAALSGFIESGLFENIIFCWVMHEEDIVKTILSRIPAEKCRFFLFTLTADKKTLRERLARDAECGKRSGGIFARSEERAERFGKMLSYKIDNSRLTPAQTAESIAETVRGETNLLPYKNTPFLTDEGRLIREEVFMDEQGFASEFDGRDNNCRHLVFYKGDEPAACCRYFAAEEDGAFTVGRIAVRKKFRGQGLGRYVLRAAEECARQDGAAALTLCAQVRARGFYEKCGYAAFGEQFPEEGVPHVRMRKDLNF